MLPAWPAGNVHTCMAAALLQERKEPATPPSVGYDRHWTHTPDLPAAAATALVQQEGKRLSRHATADGASLQLQGILRNPRQMPAVLNACSRLAQLTDVNLACNALDELAAAQLLGAQYGCGHGCSEMRCQPLCVQAMVRLIAASCHRAQDSCPRALRHGCIVQACNCNVFTGISAGLLDQAPHTCSLNLGQNQLGPPTAQHLAAVLRWRPKVSKFRQSASNVLASLHEAPREPLGEGFHQVRGEVLCSMSPCLVS